MQIKTISFYIKILVEFYYNNFEKNNVYFIYEVKKEQVVES